MTSMAGTDFHNVDDTDDPRARVAYLDAMTALEFIREYKRQTFSLLAIRPGARVLDVGCGTGDDLRELAALVGPSGHVVGVDASPTMIDEARVRTRGLQVDCRQGNAQQLDFPDRTFDACRSDRVLQHLERPERAVAEMARVTRPGGAVVVTEPDWDTLIVDSPDADVTRRIANALCDHHPSARVGRSLSRLAKQADLTAVTITGTPMILTDWSQAKRLFALDAAATLAVQRDAISEAEATGWLLDLAERAKAGVFFSCVTLFTVCGRKS